METSSLNVDLHPDYVRCEIKGKITQLVIPEEILVEQSKVQRSQTTGALVVTCMKVDAEQIKAKQDKYAQIKADAEKRLKLKELDKPIEKENVGANQTLKDWEKTVETKPAAKKDKPAFVPDFSPDDVPPLE